MRISLEKLALEAEATGFRPDFLEKVARLLGFEKAFLDLLLDQGEIDPTLLTNDPFLQQRILLQPLLKWKAINVRRHKL